MLTESLSLMLIMWGSKTKSQLGASQHDRINEEVTSSFIYSLWVRDESKNKNIQTEMQDESTVLLIKD